MVRVGPATLVLEEARDASLAASPPIITTLAEVPIRFAAGGFREVE